MKRRNVLKTLSLLPLAGSAIPFNSSLASPLAENLTAAPFNTGSPVEVTLESFLDKNNIYRTHGIEPVINCRGIFTIIGGSLKRPQVKSAMELASKNFAQMDEVADGIGQELAKLTGAEWGVVSAGCAAGLKLVTAAVVAGGDPEKLVRIPNLEGLEKTEVIVPRTSRNAYDHAIRNIGVTMVNVESMEELENAINPKTAMIYLVNGDRSWTGAPMSLENIVAVAKTKNIPVLFDAANEILTFPPVHLKRGATIVAYSGGKAICGPQSCGLILGNKDILTSAWLASSPHHGPCRDNKVDRDEMFGMVAAVRAWKEIDHDAILKQWYSYLDHIIKKVSGIKSVQTMIHVPSTQSGLSNVSPEVVISWDKDVLNITGLEMADELARTKPRIAVAAGGGRGKDPNVNGIAVTTIGMQPGEEKIAADKIYNILTAKRSPISTEMKAPSQSLAGSWDVEVKFASSLAKHKLFIEQDGNWIKGGHQTTFAVSDLSGSIEGNQIRLQSSLRLIGDHVPYTFTGTVSGDQMTGSIFMGEYRSAKFTAIRDKKMGPKQKIFVPSGAPLAS
ncbi:MAG: selenocysteine synthase [Sphingobacteriales bacterium 17-39-43]|uniref:aminotransferase class V-fold PLP-dependent enzyme n=1 Tax=Daejeonella sp. TaxID=2805397 RepID=UPI000BC8ABBF|nr:aminotransferase class V-fold PLP-dependent enzyme [Daejeonella sp.]OYZ31487.1 MAG: selenocysteine synthase [Sphingobacteriales bacterium 16-39-50]OYZ60467.1 MAG: selenocysteine synthase [Sphingobacteriales bacterium 24-40-4]OZA24707.1 MAG: selenocysteine synthase [Sphingobacteriales bacterium 17-39-43]HQT22652.1 aminotransferase class V-fold PLP-dependent enzyme [Daejeonella sp.]HQT57658.1 aminotransferase class V-fold PLP-dependent enzyme [Daejeonella sp.]